MDRAVDDIMDLPARQQPEWAAGSAVEDVRQVLHERPGLIEPGSEQVLLRGLAEVAAGRAFVLQAGDCAEDPDESSPDHVERKSSLIDLLALTVQLNTGLPVLRVGRMGGQFGKPRSSAMEKVNGLELPAYRGHMVNSPEPDPYSRRPRTDRMLDAYDASSEVVDNLRPRDPDSPALVDSTIWTSHEALVLDYELPMTRRDPDGRLLITSTHWPWIGERTRQVDGAHVSLLSRVVNPVACKVGPTATPQELVELCAKLDPDRVPGRLTLIARIGASKVGGLLPGLVGAVREAGHPVIWLTDPMHANTVTTPAGLKTRFVDTIVREAVDFQHAVRCAGGVAGGLHLETAIDPVTECVQNADEVQTVRADTYSSLLDPRLNPTQALAVVSAWTA